MHRQRLTGHSLSVTGIRHLSSAVPGRAGGPGVNSRHASPGLPASASAMGFESLSRRSRPGYAAVRGYETATTRAGR
jgi:hypothetical protein